MFNINDTIVAISSGNINQAISIIRLSGSDAIKIIKKIFTGKVDESYKASYGLIKDGNTILDEVIVLCFLGKKSFVGEDTIEINAHGGTVVTNKILRLILSHGARLALPGEFSKRSFLNGKMDLVKAQAIDLLINAKTDLQAEIAANTLNGETSKLINDLKNEVLHIIAIIETNIDYPEYDDVEILTTKKLLPLLKKLMIKIENIIQESKDSQLINEGIKVAIIGKPNAGKSSLLNSILEKERAIVTDIEGTTRDVVDGQKIINGLLFTFLDTAGIRENSKDEIEKIGMKKSLSTAKEADIIIHLLNDKKDEMELNYDKPIIKVFNKSDIKYIENEINISAKNNDIKMLIDELKNRFSKIKINNNAIYNSRQLSLIDVSKQNISFAISALENGFTPDVAIVDIQQAWYNLTNILGRADNKDLLDEIFSNFCLGK
ncbi:MAG: tRNA uridine-5-carboxymethylaminomethyl(34) synthesis GTPase MnmE [Mycoplasma sp.]|nr:tRNA uridine-5-carboxymethylaminomethyl(34) synthesis GTPase MnmE [Mycoplasma sp.]